ncbi:hypothetical protein CEXT_416861, partial [Caerostris extrusa]
VTILKMATIMDNYATASDAVWDLISFDEKNDTKSNGDLSASPLAAVVDAMFKSQAKKQTSGEQNRFSYKTCGSKSQSECQAIIQLWLTFYLMMLMNMLMKMIPLMDVLILSPAECNSKCHVKNLRYMQI